MLRYPSWCKSYRSRERGYHSWTVYISLVSGAGKLLSHESAVPLEPTADNRDSDDESVDLETQQLQVSSVLRHEQRVLVPYCVMG